MIKFKLYSVLCEMKEFVLLSFEEGHRLVYSAVLITNGCIRGCHVVAHRG